MGSRFEVTYQRPIGSGAEVYAVIYDTATQGESYTINDNGVAQEIWVGTRFDDAIAYGAGINEINGGGGKDTFVATAFTASQVSIGINANNQVVFVVFVFVVDGADVDTLDRFSSIALANATVAINDDTLTYEALTGEGNLSQYEYRFAHGNFLGSADFYFWTGSEPYANEEVDYDGVGRLVRVAFSDLTGAPYSSYEYDYVGGVFAGSQFTYASVPAGASYSSYEIDYNQSSALAGAKYFFASVSGQSYSSEEVDFDADMLLSRVLLAGFWNQPYSLLELDYNAGVYAGYKAYYKVSGQSYTNQEVDVSASGQFEKVIYSGLTGTPYQTVAQDYAGGAVADVIYGFSEVTGQPYYADQVTEDANGVALVRTFDLNSGGHIENALRGGQTLTSLGNDRMSGSAQGTTTFVLNPVYGADSIANLTSADLVSMSSSEFATFAALQGVAVASGGNVVIAAADGDTLTLKNMTLAMLAGMSANFTFHM